MKQYYNIDYIKMKKEGLNPIKWILLENIHFRQAITESGYCEDTRQELADWFGYSLIAIKKMIRELIEAGFLTSNSKHQVKTTKKYHLMMQEGIDEEIRKKGIKKYTQDEKGYKKVYPEGYKKVYPEGIKKYTPSSIYRENELDNKLDVLRQKNNDVNINSDALEVAKYLLAKIKSHKQNFKEPNLNNWAKDIDRAMRIDKRTKEQLINAIDFIYSPKGSFWIPNILSGAKLRKHYDTLEMQYLRANSNDRLEQNKNAIKEFLGGTK